MTGDGTITGDVCEFTASDGYVLKYRHYQPVQEPRAYIIGLHGIQSHSGWYEWSSSRLAAAGFDVRFLDRRGAGMNSLDRGHSTSAAQLMADAADFVVKLAEDRDPTVDSAPVVLSAVSWGGKLAAALSPHLRFALSGLALLYPAVYTNFEPKWWERCALRMASRTGLGRRMVAIPLDDPRLFTDNPGWQTFIREDPLTLRRVSFSFLNATLDLTERAADLINQKVPPTFLAFAGRDEIVDVPSTKAWASQLPPEHTRIVEYPDARHTLEFDDCREQFVADLIEWVESLPPAEWC